MTDLIKTNSQEVMKSLASQDLDVLTPEGYLNSLTPEQIGIVFSQLDKIEKFTKGVRKIIETEVKNGAQIPGLQMVYDQGKPVRGFTNDEDVANKLREMGYTDDIIYKPQQLESLTTIEKIIKTKGMNELKEAGLITMVTKEPTLKVVYIDPNAKTLSLDEK